MLTSPGISVASFSVKLVTTMELFLIYSLKSDWTTDVSSFSNYTKGDRPMYKLFNCKGPGNNCLGQPIL